MTFDMEQKLDEMMAEFCESRKQMEASLASSLCEFKREMNAVQEKTVQQFNRRIGSSIYEFRRKGNEHQFNFNCGVKDTKDAARYELVKVKPVNPETQEAMKKAELSLDKGAKALVIRQKHIKIADRSDLSWATVKHYVADHLADGPEDEKEIARSEEVQKEQERAQAKRGAKHGGGGGGGGGGGKQRRSRQDHMRDYRFDPYMTTDYGRRERLAAPPPGPQRQFKPCVLGPCFRCGACGHIQSSCIAPPRMYPLLQPVVSTSAELKVTACVDSVCLCDELDINNQYVGSDLCCESVDSTVCNPENIKACASNEEAHSPLLKRIVDKVSADSKGDPIVIGR